MIDPTGRSHAQNFNNRHQTTKHIVMKKTTINTRNSSTTNNSSNPKTPTMKMSIANNKKSSTTKGSQNQKPQNKTKMKKKAPVTPVKESTTKQFTYERKFVNPIDLKIHPLLNVIGFEQPDNFFTEHANHFNYLERSVITEDMFAITHPTDVLAAQQLEKDKIEVVIMKGATIHDVIKFVRTGDSKAVVTCGDGNSPILSQSIPYTDFLPDECTLWVENDGEGGMVILLPSEH